MVELHFTEQFVDDVATIWSPRVGKRLRRVLRMLERFPESGSSLVPDSIAEEFGSNVRKCAVGPFDLVYEYDSSRKIAVVHGLISQKMAR